MDKPAVPPLIAFRHLVAQMIRDGAFKAPEEPLLYSIKERQPSEIRHRLNDGSLDVYEQPYVYHSEKSGSHLGNIFFRDDYLSAADYTYLFSVLGGMDRSTVLKTLAKNTCIDHNILEGPKSPWIKAFLEDYPNHLFELPNSGHVPAILNDGNLLKLLVTYFPDPAKVTELHLGIERSLIEDSRAHRNNVELKHLKDAVAGLDGTPPSTEEVEVWLKHQEVIKGLRCENQKDIVGSKQANIVLNQIKTLDALANLHPAETARLAPVVTSILSMMKEDVHLLIGVLKQPASKAIETFGKADTKADGKAIPTRMVEFASLISVDAIDPAQRKEVLGLMVSRVCEVTHKNMDAREITGFIMGVKDAVDWEGVVSGLNAKGRAALMDVFPETQYFRAYLKRQERGKTLESELGL